MGVAKFEITAFIVVLLHKVPPNFHFLPSRGIAYFSQRPNLGCRVPKKG
jgi:hypothetical protein